MKIILDTNFLVYCAKEKLDYVEELKNMFNEDYDLVVPVQVIKELEKITKKKKQDIALSKRSARYKKTTGKDKAAADLAIQIINKRVTDGIIEKVSPLGDDVDGAIINFAKENSKNVVCTLDKEMRDILGRVVLINSKGRLKVVK